MAKKLTTAIEVIDALGGHRAVAWLCELRTQSGTNNWATQGFFPARFYLVMSLALAEDGYFAEPELWGQRVPRLRPRKRPKRPNSPNRPKTPNRPNSPSRATV